ncbi:MAG: TIGR03118 family protein [Methylocella sp.]
MGTFQGSITAWAPNLPVAPTVAVTAVDNSKAGAVYTSIELGENDKGAFIYAANVHTGKIDVFDSTFKPANAELTGTFADPQIPAGFTPFGIHNIQGNLAVTYAKQNASKSFITAGAGVGFVDLFDTEGNLLQRLAAGGSLNVPWGVALAPIGFGGAGGEILVANFGDGHINAFDGKGGVQMLLNQSGQPIAAPGLWEIRFGGGTDSSPLALFITAGIDGGAHGQFSMLSPALPAAPAN